MSRISGFQFVVSGLLVLVMAAVARRGEATPVTVIPDSTNRILAVTATPALADTVNLNTLFSTWLSAGGANTQRTLQTTSVATFNAALELELGALGPGQSYQINSATLTAGDATNNYIGNATAHQVLVTYDPNTVTWNTFNGGGVAGVQYNATAAATSVPGVNSATWDLTSIVQDWLSATPSTAINSLFFASTVVETGADTFTDYNRVSWTLDAVVVPEPGSLALVGITMGIGIIALTKRRRSKS